MIFPGIGRAGQGGKRSDLGNGRGTDRESVVHFQDLIDETRKLHVCGNGPDCPGYEVETGKFKIKGYDGPIIECDKCGADMQLKTGRFGKYFGCTSEGCKNTRKLLRNGEAAPPKMDPVPMPELACVKVEDHYILRDGAAGLFLAGRECGRDPWSTGKPFRRWLPL